MEIFSIKNNYRGAVVVVKWSACSPSTPTIQVQVPLKAAVFSVKFVFEKNENKQNEASVSQFYIEKTRSSELN